MISCNTFEKLLKACLRCLRSWDLTSRNELDRAMQQVAKEVRAIDASLPDPETPVDVNVVVPMKNYSIVMRAHRQGRRYKFILPDGTRLMGEADGYGFVDFGQLSAGTMKRLKTGSVKMVDADTGEVAWRGRLELRNTVPWSA